MAKAITMLAGAGTAAAIAPALVPVQASAADNALTYRQKIANNMRLCAPGGGPAARVTVHGIKSSQGTVRVQSYRATKAEWLEKGKWINRIEAPARAGTMTFCMPLPAPGSYGIAVRHDTNGNGKTEIARDGGGMSNNPSINIFNLGKPSYRKTAVEFGPGVTSIAIQMKYM